MFYRYREIYWQNLANLYNHRYSRNTSYHGYAGVQIPEGINSLGWTGKTFSFVPLQYMSEEGFYIQIVPEIVEKEKLTVTLTNALQRIQTISFTKSGWYKIVLDKKFMEDNTRVTVVLSNTWVPNLAKEDRFDHSEDNMGVRLQQTFGLEKPFQNQQYTRERRMEDDRYINMEDDQYEKYFYYRLLDNLPNRPGIAYIHALKNAKERLASETFRPTIHYQYLQKFTGNTSNSSLKVLLINNPENPISLRWYKGSKWYQDQLTYLNNLSSNHTTFIDLHNFLRPQHFSDFHHLTYPAMEFMNSVYGNYILQQLEKQ